MNCIKPKKQSIGFVQTSKASAPSVCLHRYLLASLILCALGSIPSAIASASNAIEPKTPEQMGYEVKAAFIYNFMKFIQWPQPKEHTSDSSSHDLSIKIIILGNNPFKTAFQKLLEKNIQGRPIELIEVESFERFRQSYPNRQDALNSFAQTYLADLQQCHLLYICESEKDSVDDLLTLAAGKSMVTVSDIAEFAEKNGMIGFVMEKQKVRFEINLDAAYKENIKISSQLLGLARRVYKKEGKPS